MTWQFFIAARYLTSKHKERFISLISLISILGVAIGVGALIIVISVMSGFDEDLRDKIIGTYSHIEITSDYGVKSSPELVGMILGSEHVRAASPFLHGQALIRFRESVVGIIAKGIEPEGETAVNKIGEYIKEGKLDVGDYGIVIGTELASKLGIKTGDAVSLFTPGNIDGIEFRVAGIFRSGMYEYDAGLVYMSIPASQELLNARGLVSGFSVRVDDAFNVDKSKKAIRENIGKAYSVRSWIDLNKNLIEALKLEKTVMFIILALIVMVACFNIAGTLIMTVLEKTKDVGVLKAVGASGRDIMAVFAIQGTMIGFVGTSIGAALGLALCWCLKTYKFINLPQDIYYIDKLPVKFAASDILTIIGASMVISMIATIYPAYKASKLDPVEALRYE